MPFEVTLELDRVVASGGVGKFAHSDIDDMTFIVADPAYERVFLIDRGTVLKCLSEDGDLMWSHRLRHHSPWVVALGSREVLLCWSYVARTLEIGSFADWRFGPRGTCWIGRPFFNLDTNTLVATVRANRTNFVAFFSVDGTLVRRFEQTVSFHKIVAVVGTSLFAEAGRTHPFCGCEHEDLCDHRTDKFLDISTVDGSLIRSVHLPVQTRPAWQTAIFMDSVFVWFQSSDKSVQRIRLSDFRRDPKRFVYAHSTDHVFPLTRADGQTVLWCEEYDKIRVIAWPF